MKTWGGNRTCDFCKKDCGDSLYDGKTIYGPWAVMCRGCFKNYGIGLGLGRGQEYRKKDNQYIKVAG